MRSVLAVIPLLLLVPQKSFAFKWEKCKKVYKSWGYSKSQSGDAGTILFEYTMQFTTQTTLQTSTSTSSYVSSTGDCKAFGMAEEERFRYIAETHTELKMESANGEGEHVSSLASLYGCKVESHPEFAEMLKSNHSEIFNSVAEDTPSGITERITGNLLKTESLRKSCNLERI